MNTKNTVLFALLVPGLMTLAACNKADNDMDDAAMPADTAAMDTMPADTMPADTMPADHMMGDEMMGDEMTFAQMDKNSDGGVSMDELSSTDMLHQHFSVADADGNGMLSDAEISKHRSDMAMDTPR